MRTIVTQYPLTAFNDVTMGDDLIKFSRKGTLANACKHGARAIARAPCLHALAQGFRT